MASKYLQKYPVPSGFQQILHDFTRQVLRDQPPNIIEYAAKYFEMLEKGKKFEFESKFNVKKTDKKYELQHNPKEAEEIVKKATHAVDKINSAEQAQPQTSIKNIAGAGAESDNRNSGQPISTNTLIKETGHNYVQDLSKKVENDQVTPKPPVEDDVEAEEGGLFG